MRFLNFFKRIFIMKPLNTHSHELIDLHRSQLVFNLACVADLITQAKNSNSEQARNQIREALDLTSKSCSHALIVINGLQAQVLNEGLDFKNHSILSWASSALYEIYCGLFTEV